MSFEILNREADSAGELPTKKPKTTGDSRFETLEQEIFEVIGRFLPHEDKIKLSRASKATYTKSMNITCRDIRGLVERVAKKALSIIDSKSQVSVGEGSDSYRITKIKKYLDKLTKHRFEKPQSPADVEKLKLILEVQSLNEILKDLDLKELDSLISYLHTPCSECHSDFRRLVRDLRDIRSNTRELLNEARAAPTNEAKYYKLWDIFLPLSWFNDGSRQVELSTSKEFNDWLDIAKTQPESVFHTFARKLFNAFHLPNQTIDKILSVISDTSTTRELQERLMAYLNQWQWQNLSDAQYLQLLELFPQTSKNTVMLSWYERKAIEQEISDGEALPIRTHIRGMEKDEHKIPSYKKFVKLNISEAETLLLIDDIWLLSDLASKVELLNALATRLSTDTVVNKIVELFETKFHENPNEFFLMDFESKKVFSKISHQEILNRLLPVVLDFIETDEEIPTEGTGGDLAVKLNRIQAILDAKGAIPQGMLERVSNIVFSIDQENLFGKSLMTRARNAQTNEVYELKSNIIHIWKYSAIIEKLMQKDLSAKRWEQCLQAFEFIYKRYKKSSYHNTSSDHNKYAEAVAVAFEKASMPEKREECLLFIEELCRSGQFDSRTERKVLKGIVKNSSFERSDLERLLVRFDTQLSLMQKLELFVQHASSHEEISVESAVRLLGSLQDTFTSGVHVVMERISSVKTLAMVCKLLIQKTDSDELISQILDQMEKIHSKVTLGPDVHLEFHKVLECVFEKNLSPKLLGKALNLMKYQSLAPSQEESKSRSSVYDAMYKTAGIDSLIAD